MVICVGYIITTAILEEEEADPTDTHMGGGGRCKMVLPKSLRIRTSFAVYLQPACGDLEIILKDFPSKKCLALKKRFIKKVLQQQLKPFLDPSAIASGKGEEEKKEEKERV